jgi:LuxR family transcriptional regulator, maltose regulon positive regulatory protein
LSTVAPRPQAQLSPSKLFIPALDTDLVVRDRLRTRLSAANGARMILVSAPAGSGKTTLIADWVRGQTAPVAWISLDPDDDDPQRFMDYLAEAVHGVSPAAAERAAVLLGSTPPPEPHDVVTAIAAVLARESGPEPETRGVIVLDDYHFVTHRQLHDAVALLVDRAPSVSLVLITRSDPPLPLARLRARRQLCEIREADLRFAPDEAEVFLERIGARALEAESVQSLTARTEGWAAGLQLAALALRDHDDPERFIAEFHGTHAFVADFLADEVLAGIPEERQRFLVRSSLLSRLTGPLCDAALECDGSQALLDELSRANLFLVPLDGERRWFRYHHLFGDLLRRRADRLPEDERRAILHRASAWSETQGFVDDAIAYAVRTADPARAAGLVAEHGLNALARGEALKALRWIDALPDELVRSSPDHCVIAAWASSLVERYAGIESYSRRALELAARGPGEWPHVPEVELHARTLVAGVEATVGAQPDQSLAALGSVLAEADPADILLRASAEIMSGKALCHAGRYDAALPHHGRALQLGIQAGSDLLRLAAITGQGKTLLLGGRVRRAIAVMEAEVERRINLREILNSQTANLYAMMAVGYLQTDELDETRAALRDAWSVMGADPDDDDAWLSMVRFGRSRHTPFHSMAPLAYYGLTAHIGLLRRTGELSRAAEHLEALESLNPPPTGHAERAVVDAMLVRVWAAAGDATRLQHWVRTHRPFTTGTAYWDRAVIRTHARAALGGGDAGSALELLGRVIDPEDPATEIDLGTAEALAIAAVSAARLDRRGDEARFADAALELSAREGRAGIWISPDGAAAPLLERAIARASASPHALTFAADTLGRLRDRVASASPMGTLSDRELAVLRLIAAGHSNQEIADALFLAVGTVKKHTHNIYGKLGVRSRTAAVRAAGEQGLLGSSAE